ncbi:hypothetical protein FACS1894105_02900 [Clostridia bacterium]|nr:hypothetical protein FACS1894105_02900 [Clostridia bacterium]
MGQGVSREQIARAKEIGIEEYILSHEPNNVKRIGQAYYLRDHDSLKISNGLWNWHSRGIGGKNVIDYLIFVRGYCFVDAVRHLAGDDYSISQPRAVPISKAPSERKPFALPSRNADNKRVIAYLEQRGIDRPLIDECINRRLLYESAIWHNCVFVGRDDKGKARFAAMRGTTGDFKCDAEGSDKRYGLHWVLDVIFNEDSSRNREGYSIHNFSLIRKIVFNLVKLDDSFGKVPFNRKLTNYQHDFANIENLIFSVIPFRA